MYRTFNPIRVFPFSLSFRPPQVHIVPQSFSELALVLSVLLSLGLAFRVLRRAIFKSPRESASDKVDTLATKDISKTCNTRAVPLSTTTSSFTASCIGFISSIGTMIAAPLTAAPVPVTEPPSAVVNPAIARLEKPETPHPVKQPYEAFLVLDVEATCQEGTDFNWPNEIIEWPVVLLRWRDMDSEGRAKELYIAGAVDEFRSFVKPSWRPELSAFCTSLTGITQAQVDRAPKFNKVLESFQDFLQRNKLIDPSTGEKLERYIWCTDGPFDIRDFVVKQCFISKIQMPIWLKGDVLDVRKVVTYYLALQEGTTVARLPKQKNAFPKPGVPVPRRRALNIEQQLRVLGLSEFIGRQHSGIDDTRNIARVVVELAKRGIRLEPNTAIYPGRRWQWMGKPGQVLEEYCFI